MCKKQSRRGEHLYFFLACILIAPILMCGCSHVYEGFLARPEFKEANDFSSQGNYKASLRKYEQIIAQYPTEGDRGLFEMGFIYAFPRNQEKDYKKSLECFQKLIKDYPVSGYRHDSEVMISLIDAVIRKDKRIMIQQRQTGAFEQEVKSRDNKIITQQKQIETLEQQVKELEKKIEQMKEIDMKGKKKKLTPLQ